MDHCGGTSDNDPMDLQLLADDEAWAQAGEELKQRDPGRYLAILTVVQDMVAIYRDPIRAKRKYTGTIPFVSRKPGGKPD